MTTRRRSPAKSPPPAVETAAPPAGSDADSPDSFAADAFAADPFAALGDDFAALDDAGGAVPAGLDDDGADHALAGTAHGVDDADDPFAKFAEAPPPSGDDDDDHDPSTSDDDPFARFADDTAAHGETPIHEAAHGDELPSLDELAAVQLDADPDEDEPGIDGDRRMDDAPSGALAALPSFDDAPEEDSFGQGGGLDLDSPGDDDAISFDDMAGLPAIAGSETMFDAVDTLPAPVYPRFLFDTSFDVLPAHLRIELEPTDPEPETPPAPLFDASELEAARAVARAEGEAAGYDAAVRSAEAQTSRLMEAALGQLPGLLVDRDAAVASLTKEAARLAHAMVAKMLPELTQRHGLVEVEAVVLNSLEKAVDSPRILFRLHPANVELMRPKVEEMAALAGFAGRLMVTADTSLGEADVRVDWGDGGAERLAARAWSEISAIVTRAIEALDKAVIPAGAVVGWGQGGDGDTEGSELEQMAR